MQNQRINIVLFVISIVFSLGLVEIGANIWLGYMANDADYKRYSLPDDIDKIKRRWTPHHYLNYYPTPKYSNDDTRHNALGYRDEEFPIKKDRGIFRIVALGGSTIYTVAVNDNKKTFTAQLENVLREKYGHVNVEVINAGVAGYDSFESLINLEFRVLDLEPDLIIIYHGTNDVHSRLVVPSAYKGDNSARRKQWRLDVTPFIDHSCFLRIIRTKLGYRHQAHLGSYTNAYTYKGAGSVGYDDSNSSLYEELLRQNPPVYFERNLINMIAVARANSCGVLLATWAHSPHFNDYASTGFYEQGYNENNLVVRRIADAYDVPMFDFADVMPRSKQFWSDGRHVNADGARIKALLFAEFIDTANLIGALKQERKNGKIKAKDSINTIEHNSKSDEAWRLQKIAALLPPLKIIDYGPKESRLGEPFNLQPTGNSAIWIQAAGARSSVKIVFNGEKLSTAVSGQNLSAEISSALLQKPGKIAIYLIDESTGKTSSSVYLNLASP